MAIILALALTIAVTFITGALFWQSIFRPPAAGISENTVQVLTTVFTGIVGILGSYIGYQAADKKNQREREQDSEDTERPHDGP